MPLIQFEAVPDRRDHPASDYWRALHEVVDTEAHLDSYSVLHGVLTTLGIAKGRPFAPDERTRDVCWCHRTGWRTDSSTRPRTPPGCGPA